MQTVTAKPISFTLILCLVALGSQVPGCSTNCDAVGCGSTTLLQFDPPLEAMGTYVFEIEDVDLNRITECTHDGAKIAETPCADGTISRLIRSEDAASIQAIELDNYATAQEGWVRSLRISVSHQGAEARSATVTVTYTATSEEQSDGCESSCVNGTATL